MNILNVSSIEPKHNSLFLVNDFKEPADQQSAKARAGKLYLTVLATRKEAFVYHAVTFNQIIIKCQVKFQRISKFNSQINSLFVIFTSKMAILAWKSKFWDFWNWAKSKYNLDCRRVSTVPRIKRWYSMFGKCGEDFWNCCFFRFRNKNHQRNWIYPCPTACIRFADHYHIVVSKYESLTLLSIADHMLIRAHNYKVLSQSFYQ